MQNRPDSQTNPGGDTVQMEQTARALRGAGHDVTVSFELDPHLSDFDLVHLFNLTRPFETFAQAENAKRQAKPYVLSSVYWDLDAAVPWYAYEFPRNWWRRLIPERFRRAMRRRELAHENPKDLQRRILREARLVFPNSDAEALHIVERFDGLSPDKFCVVRNGVLPPPRSDDTSAEDYKGAFVCAGAIGPRKNQLGLVKAFRRLPNERLLILGGTAPRSERYYEATTRAAGPNVEFRDYMPHHEVSGILRNAKALVQPSFIETPGLSAMEAAAVGTPIVVADVVPVREYFGDLGHYCDPASPPSIAEACRGACLAKKRDGQDFVEAYEWMTVLETMTRAYAELEARKTL
ncbi:MAG: glycosyltransferase [Phycisphaerales bacterium]|nr:glycosyltransferase [Phycisphaerales bacterium]